MKKKTTGWRANFIKTYGEYVGPNLSCPEDFRKDGRLTVAAKRRMKKIADEMAGPVWEPPK